MVALFLVQALPGRAVPYACTQPAAPVGSVSAALNGAAVPNGLPSTAWFEWGTNSTYGQVSSPVSVGAGASVVRVRAPLSGLAPGSVYCFRLVVSNASGGVSFGGPQRFITGGSVTAWGNNSYGQAKVPAGWQAVVGVAAGATHTVVLKADGTLGAAGRFYGTGTDLPPALANVASVAAGWDHDLALLADGTVRAWGDNYKGQATVPADLTDVVAVAAGDYHSLALRADGTVQAWGYNDFGQTSVPAGLSNVVAIAAGSIHSLALQADGTVVFWGRYHEGGSGAAPWVSNAVAIAAGPNHDLVLNKDGQVLVWGRTFSQGITNLPTPADLTNCQAVAAGWDYSLAIKGDGTAAAWGTPLYNYGQATIPSGLSNVAALVGGGGHSVALAPNAPPAAWPQTRTTGVNQDLVLTLMGTDFNQDPLGFRIMALPTAGALYQYVNGGRGAQITQPNTAVADAAGRLVFVSAAEAFGNPYATFTFVANDGQMDSALATVTLNILGPTAAATQLPGPVRPTLATLNGMATAGNLPATAWFEWGPTRSYGQNTAPQAIPASLNVLRVSATVSNLAAHAIYHCRLVVANAGGTVYGADQIFTTGRKVTPWGGTSYHGESAMPPGLSNTVAIAAGSYHSLALDAQGKVSAWGWNYRGETAVPPDLSGVMAIAASSGHSLALKEDGTVAAWGYGPNGETNVPANLSNIVAIAAGSYHNLALRADGTVAVWGSYSQTNVLATNNNVVAIAAGQSCSVLLKADGSVFEWPVFYLMPSGVSNVTAIAAGDSHTLALKADGTVVAWGYNGQGQTNVPPGLSNVIAIAAGDSSSLALKTDGTIVGWGFNAYGQVQAPAGLGFATGIAGGNAHSLALANAPASANALTNYGAADHDLTLTLRGADPNQDPLQFQITSLPGAGSLYQFTPAGRGAAIGAPNTLVQDPAGRVIFAPAVGARGNPYTTFAYAAGDDEAEFSAPATVTIGLVVTPYAATRPALAVTPTGATLNGTVVPNALPTTAWFEWGADAATGQRTPAMDVGSGNARQNVSAPLTGLSSNSLYHFQLVVSNALGVTRAATRLFTTGSKAAAWGYPSTMQMYLGNVTAVAVGADHALVLRPDGSVAQWGYGASSPAQATNVVALAAAASNSLALKADGTVLAWGDNRYGQANVPADLTNAIAVACGETHSLALRSDGAVAAWGDNLSRQCDVPIDLNYVVELAGGDGFSLALLADGTVRSWGSGILESVPPGLTNVVSIAAGAAHALALKGDGTVAAWGGDPGGAATVPLGLSNVVAIATTLSNSLALRLDGTVVAWGDNSRSQVSLAASFSNVAAIAIGPMQPMLLRSNSPPSVSPGAARGLANQDLTISLSASDPDLDWLTLRISALPTAGTLYQYATSGRGAPITALNTPVNDSFNRVIYAPATNGYGSPYDSFSFFASDGEAECAPALLTISIPAPLYASSQRPSSVTALSADFNGAVFGSGLPSLAWFEWGLGAGFSQATAPLPVANSAKLTRVTASVAGLLPNTTYHYRLVASNATGLVRGADQRFRTGGKVTPWGTFAYGLTNVPPGLNNVVSVAAGASFNLALRADGTVRAWGGDPYYTPAATNVPAGLTNVIAIAAGRAHSVGLRADGTVANWGGYYYGLSAITNMPRNLSNVVSIACGLLHTLALRHDGTIVPWGDNSYYQTNIPYGLRSNVVAVAAGAYHSLALLMDGTVAAWGNNSSGQRTVPAGLTNVIAVAAGLNHSLALKEDGTVLAWGNNAYGQTTVPAGLAEVVAIAAGDNHSLALKADGTLVAWGRNTSGQTTVPAGLAEVAEVAGSADHALALGGNVVPAAANLQVSGYPNRDVLVSFSGTDLNGDALAFRVASLPDRGTLYQYNAGGRGAPILTADTAVADPAARVLFAPASYAVGSPFSSFTFLANDGQSDSAPAVATVNLSLPPAPKIDSTACQRTSDGGFHLRFTGAASATYTVYGSTNLIQWQPIGFGTSLGSGQFEFLFPPSPSASQYFYRVGAP